VVYDSEGAKEYAECLLKMKFLTDPPKRFELIETLLHDASRGYWLLERHIERLKATAQYFNFAYDEGLVRAHLAREVAARATERLRVRLLLAEDGRITITSTALPPADVNSEMRYAVSPTRLESTNPFLFHKTTRRELYDSEWRHYNETQGAGEVIYLNERGEIAEGSRTNIFIERNGKLLTPPLGSGLLPGVLRAELLAAGRAIESVLLPEDLETADAIYLGNSVRGLVRAGPVAEKMTAK
jgi:para-aminobenzoate synthetase/4-amino-4-deoxychorismate lyase